MCKRQKHKSFSLLFGRSVQAPPPALPHTRSRHTHARTRTHGRQGPPQRNFCARAAIDRVFPHFHTPATMHTALYRANSLFTAASTALAVMAIGAAVADLRLPREPGALAASVVRVEGLDRSPTGDRAWLLLDVAADVRPLFHWNTRQAYVWVGAQFGTQDAPRTDVTLWSMIVASPRDAAITEPSLRIDYPYALTDRGQGLRGTPFNLTIGWQTTPHVGVMWGGVRTVGSGVFPAEYAPPPESVRGDWD